MKDDGGFPITGYKIDMLDIQTNNWLEITFIEVFPVNLNPHSSDYPAAMLTAFFFLGF